MAARRVDRETEAERIRAVSQGVEQQRARVIDQLGNQATPQMIARIYARAAVAADDTHGRQHGLITQADHLRWDDLSDRRTLLAGFANPTAHGGPDCSHPGCSACDAALAYQRLTLLLDRRR